MDGRDRDFIQHLPRLRRYARALTGDRGRADDLVQDTLERALVKFHLWQPGSDLRAWLFTIMHNVFINQLRAGAGTVIMPLDDETVLPAIRATQSDRLEVLDLQIALSRLPEEQRTTLILVALEDMSYEEAAKVTGVPVGTVRSRLSRARHALIRMVDGLTINEISPEAGITRRPAPLQGHRREAAGRFWRHDPGSRGWPGAAGRRVTRWAYRAICVRHRGRIP